MAFDIDKAIRNLAERRGETVEQMRARWAKKNTQTKHASQEIPMSAFFTGFEKAADVSKAELREELKKHEERETPAQEAAESKKEQEVERRAGVEKKAGLGKVLEHLGKYHQGYLGLGGLVASGVGAHASLRGARARERQLALQEKKAAELTTKKRNALDDSAFVYPEERKFPIHDRAHARNALARAHFAPDPGKVRAAVHAKYPDMGEEKSAFFRGFLRRRKEGKHQEALNTFDKAVEEQKQTGKPYPEHVVKEWRAKMNPDDHSDEIDATEHVMSMEDHLEGSGQWPTAKHAATFSLGKDPKHMARIQNLVRRLMKKSRRTSL